MHDGATGEKGERRRTILMRRTVTTVTTAMKQRQQQKGPNGPQEVSNRARGSFELSFPAPVESDNSQALLKPSKGLLGSWGALRAFWMPFRASLGFREGVGGVPRSPKRAPRELHKGLSN